jgi:hypothetical protein
MSFVSPKWDASQSHYVIEVSPAFSEMTRSSLSKDASGVAQFSNADLVHDTTDSVVDRLIQEGDKNKWFSKLPSHEQLMKRVRHSFKGEPLESHNAVVLTTLLLTPKQLTLLWSPMTYQESSAPPLYIEDSEGSEGSDSGTEPEISESNLPPVALTDDTQETQEEYLLTRLRAARARVEAEQIRMQYFEATGRMPPDSESEDE